MANAISSSSCIVRRRLSEFLLRFKQLFILKAIAAFVKFEDWLAKTRR